MSVIIHSDDMFEGAATTEPSYQEVTKAESSNGSDLALYLEINFYTKAYVQPVIFICGILTNAMTFVTLYKMTMARTCKTLLIALCITDFFACVFGLEYVLLGSLLLNDKAQLCRISSGVVTVLSMKYIYLIFLSMSSVIIVLISVIRSYLLQHPLKAIQKYSPSRVRKILGALFCAVGTVCAPLPLLIMWNSCSNDHTSKICIQYLHLLPQIKNIQIYFYVLALIFGPGLNVTNIIYWYKIKRLLKRNTKDSIQMQQRLVHSPEALLQQRKTMRVTKMFVFVLLFNLICLLPFSLQTLAAIAVDRLMSEACVQNTGVAVIFKTLSESLLSLVPCVNFWAYLVINKDFKSMVKKLLHLKSETDENLSPGASEESLQSV